MSIETKLEVSLRLFQRLNYFYLLLEVYGKLHESIFMNIQFKLCWLGIEDEGMRRERLRIGPITIITADIKKLHMS
jgi:hypothetical protein